MTIRVAFLAPDGSPLCTRDAAAGTRLLDAAQAAGLPIEGTCDGQMACSTCHMIVAPDDFARLPPPSADEEDLLDLAPGVSRHSRLACQVRLQAGLGTLTARLPPG